MKDIDTNVDFDTSDMGMDKVVFGQGRIALSFGKQKINLHQLGNEIDPKATSVQSGSADLCVIINQSISEAIARLKVCNVSIFEGSVKYTGAIGKILSAYFRDPDGNIIELLNYEIL